VALFLVTGCASEDMTGNKSTAVVHLSLRASSDAINTDKTSWEDRVDEVRMIVFNPSGNAVYNDRLNFPNGFNYHSEGIPFTPGTYDFYFIANESAYAAAFSTALSAVKTKSDFQTDARFQQLQYNPDFTPDGTTSTGRFLMSAYYTGIQVFQGGTKEIPNPLILPTGKVELIRALAKVEVVFQKKVPGSVIPSNSVSSVQLTNVAKNYSVPPLDAFYTGATTVSNALVPADFDYTKDSIGAVTFYIPEFLVATGGKNFTQININDKTFAMETGQAGLALQRRTIAGLSNNSVIRNYNYVVNASISAAGGIQLKVCVKPWSKDAYQYIFQDPDRAIVTPPVVPTDSSVIVPTTCGKIEIRSNNEMLQQGLQGAYGDVVNWYDPTIGGPSITKGNPPYYCEKKYGAGWRLINACELMSFLGLFDQTYRIWQSNTWQGVNSGLPFYPLTFRQAAQDLLEKLTGTDMSKYTLTDDGKDSFGGEKLGMLDDDFTPGDILITENDYPGGWPFTAPPNDGNNKWYPMEVVINVKGYWYTGYLNMSDPANYNKILYQQFEQFSYSSTVSRCVRDVE
jgi:hypothetical protein